MTVLFRARLLAVILFCVCTLAAQAQPVAFNVPEQVSFAGQKLRLTPDAQEVIRKHGQALVRNAKFYRAMTERADAYFPLIERVFREEGLPDDFKFLVIQESGLASDVISRSNAVGYWQFKAETAMELGLRVDPEIDERMNILASSRGAARYLTKNNNYLNNWTFTLLSYYAGLGGCKAIIKPELKGASEMELDSSTHFYILKFLAHKIAFEQAVNRSPNPALQVMEYGECEGKSLRQIAAETNVDPAQIEFYNKWCRNGIVPQDKDYTVIVPVAAGQSPNWMAMTTRPTPQLGENLKPWKEKYFFGLFEREPEPVDPSLNKTAPVFFSWNGIKAILARKEDNINRLAMAAGISREDLMEYNDLRIFDLVVPGQVYYVRSKRRKAKVPFHTVRQGETVWEVAQNYGITMEALMRKNRMHSPEKLVAGRILWLRHIRPEDHPIEYDKSVQQASPLPAVKPLAPTPIASVGAPPASTVVTQAPKIKDPDAPSLQELAEKYEAVKTNDKAEQVTVPLSTGAPVAPDDEVEAAGGETVPTPTEAKKEAAPAPGPETGVAPKPIVKPAAPAPKPAAPAPKPSATVSEEPATRMAESGTHTVAAKETLYGISRQYGIAAADLIAANPGIEAGLKIGMVLSIPPQPKANPTPAPSPAVKPAAPALKPTAPTSSLPAPTSYTVQPGDTFYSISRKFGMKVEELKTLNGLGEAPLSIGQVVRVR